MVLTEEGSVLYLYTKFEADSSIRSKNIRGHKNFKIGSRDPGHAHLGVVLWSVEEEEVSILYVSTKFEADISFVRYEGPEISKLGHATSATPI